MPGKPSRDKGARREREIVASHIAIGVQARRVPLSGAVDGFKGDVQIWALGGVLTGEVKARKDGFKTLRTWLTDADVLFLMADRAEPLVCIPWSRWAQILGERND